MKKILLLIIMGVFAVNAQKINSAGKWLGEGEFQNQPIIFGKDDAMETVMKAIEAYNIGDADLELSFYTDSTQRKMVIFLENGMKKHQS